MADTMHIQDDRPEIWPFIMLSLLLHAMAFFTLYFTMKAPKFEEKAVEVFPIIMDEQGKVPARIADIDKPAVEKKPAKPKFLGMYDSEAPEETVASGRAKTSGGKKGDGGDKERVPKKAIEKPKATKDKLYAFDKAIFDGGKKKGRDAEDGKGEPSGDYFPDFRRGTKTYLNVLRYPDVDYFVRLKRAFRMTFDPEPSLRGYFSQNQISRGSVEVVLGVAVNRSGDLAELFVFRSSGIPAYDEEALRTVRASSPFSEPPQKFVEEDGVLRMSWTFTVYL
jgi:TonB family protein